jgi:hypothetical protein
MPIYRVIVEGRGCLVRMDDGGVRRLGFLATRFHEAADGTAAATLAIDSIRAELQARLVNPPDEPAVFSIDDIVEVAAVGKPNTGFTFYSGDGDA